MMYTLAVVFVTVYAASATPQITSCDRLLSLYREMPQLIAAAIDDICPEHLSAQCSLIGKFLLEGTRTSIAKLRKMENCYRKTKYEGSSKHVCDAVADAPADGVKLVKKLFAVGSTEAVANQLSSRLEKEMENKLRPISSFNECEQE